MCLIFKKRGNILEKSQNTKENHTIIFSVSENSIAEVLSSDMQKCGILYFWQKKDHICVFICFVFIFQGWSYRPCGPQISEEGSFERKLKLVVNFFRDQESGGQLGSLPRSLFPKVIGSKFEMTISFNIAEKSNSYVFEDDLIPQSPGGTAASYELCPLSTYSIGYWEVCRHFQGFFSVGGWVSGERVTWEELSIEEFFIGEENLHEAVLEFPSIM